MSKDKSTAPAAEGLTPAGTPYKFHAAQAPYDSSVEIGAHRFGVVDHDGKPHILEWQGLPAQEDVPEGFGIVRNARAELTAVMNGGTSPNT